MAKKQDNKAKKSRVKDSSSRAETETESSSSTTNKKARTEASSTTNPVVFFDVTIGGKPAGRIEMELRADVVPKTAENFRCLCTGERGSTLDFRRNIFHRVIPDFMAQAGDITRQNGTGGRSIYGASFRDEGFRLSHDKPFLLSMANSGRDTNSSQFFITLARANYLDGKHVVFGEVTRGGDVMRKIESVGSASGKTRQKVEIEECGQLK